MHRQFVHSFSIKPRILRAISSHLWMSKYLWLLGTQLSWRMRALKKHAFPHRVVKRSALMSLRLSDIEIGTTQHELKLQQNWIHKCVQNDKVQKGSELRGGGGEVVQGEVCLRIGVNRMNLRKGKFRLNIRKCFLTVRNTSLRLACPRDALGRLWFESCYCWAGQSTR